MNVYEEVIQNKINEIAGKEISSDIQQVVHETDDISSEIIKALLFYACNPTHIALITYSRKCLSQLSSEWLCIKIKNLVFQSVNIYDDWEYRRFLELSEIISKELLDWGISSPAGLGGGLFGFGLRLLFPGDGGLIVQRVQIVVGVSRRCVIGRRTAGQPRSQDKGSD